MLDINDNDKEDLFRILESRSSASSDSSEDDFLSSTDFGYTLTVKLLIPLTLKLVVEALVAILLMFSPKVAKQLMF